MPYDIQPISGSWRGNPETLTPEPPRPKTSSALPSSYDWLRSQPFDYERYLTGTSPFAMNTIKGGLGANLFQSLSRNRVSNAVTPDPPALDVPIIGGGGAKQKVGQLSLDLLDPIGTIGMATGSFLGREQPIIGPGGNIDPLAFLQSKNIDLMNAPSRLSDYVLAPIMAAAQMATHSPMPTVQDPDLQYGFQKDPTYWRWVASADPKGMQALAYATVARTQDPTTNPWLVDQLAAQFRIDQGKTAFLTTGDAGLDYLAIKGAAASRGAYAQTGALLGDGGITMAKAAMPLWGFLGNFGMLGGYNLTEAIDPITPEERAFWNSLPAQIRQQQFGFVGAVKMGTDFVTMLPTLSGFGAVAATAKGATGLAGAAYKGYDWTLRLSKIGMAAGVTAATATWALDAAWPADLNVGPVTGEGVHEFTKRVDLSRPFSTSEFAGVINAIGYWSSGTMGVGTAIAGGKQVARKAFSLLDHAGVPHPTAGMSDLRMYAFGLGGSDMTRTLEGLGLDAAGLKLSAQRLYLSETINSIRRSRFVRWSAAIAGHPTNSFLDDLPIEQRIELANMEMSRPLEGAMAEAEAQLRIHNLARQDMSFTKVDPVTGKRSAGPIISDDALREYRIAQRNARAWDDGLARQFVNEYGAPFMQRLAGADTPEALRSWLEGALSRLPGAKPEALPAAGKHSLEWWHQMTRAVYHYSFDRWAGVIHDASDGAEEGARLNVMSQRHIFRNEYDDLRSALLGEKGEAAQANAFKHLMDKVEAEQWALAETRDAAARSRYSKEGMRAPFEPTPQALADHLDDIYETLATRRELPSIDSPTSADPLNIAHRNMHEEGLWTLGYKPVDEAGNFIASKETRTGQHVQTSWLDYPLTNHDLIELGNRGWLGNKMDAVTRGFRTWRILEYQRGSLFRSLSSKTSFSATQIEAFHAGVLNISRKHALSPQAVGRAPGWAPGLSAIGEEVNQLARTIFGPGPHIDANGNVINWRREIGSAYRQAYRLNLTAGLTSHLKASLGPVGEAITYGSEFMYVMWRFGLSPLFKGGELWESAQLNLMRRVAPNEDPAITAMYLRTGASGDPAAVAAEITGADQMIQGLARTPDMQNAADTLLGGGPHAAAGARRSWTGDERAAQGLSFYALGLKENHLQQLDRQAAEARATAFRDRVLGGEAGRNTPLDEINQRILDITDEAGNVLPGNEADLAILLRQAELETLPPDIRAALQAYPGGAPTAHQLAVAADLHATADAYRQLGTTQYARREPIPRDQTPGFSANGYASSEELHAYSRSRSALIEDAADPALLRHVRDQATVDGHQITIELADSTSGYTASKGSNAPVGIDAGIEVTGFGATPDDALLDLSRRLEAKGFGPAAPSHQPLTDDERLGMWQHAVDKGWMPDDEALRVYRRLDELVTDLEENRAINAGKATKASGRPFPPDLTDPITGQPVLRDVHATDREYDTALRSLRARRAYAKKNLTLPSTEDMALRLDAYAESVAAPKPILRSERVGPQDALPEGYTTDPAEVFIAGQTGGRASWVDKENTLPEDRGLYHATTATTAVLDTGLLSRLELIRRSAPDEAVQALSKAYHADNLAPADIRVWLTNGKTVSLTHESLDQIEQARMLEDSYSGDLIPLSDVATIKNGLTGETIYTRPQGLGNRAPEGLSATRPDKFVSTTTNWNHAQTIAERLKLVSSVANGRAGAEDITAHFERFYVDLLGDDEAGLLWMANSLGVDTKATLDETYNAIEQHIRDRIAGSRAPNEEGFRIVQELDVGLHRARYDSGIDLQPGEFDGSVIFAGSFEGAKNINPDEVGVVQVGVRTHAHPPLAEADIRAALNAVQQRIDDSVFHDTIRLHKADGTDSSFVRWSTVYDPASGGYVPYVKPDGTTEAQAFKEWMDEELALAAAEPDAAITGILEGDTLIAGGTRPGWDQQARVGPDQNEIQFPSSDTYVIDPRTHAEPIADNEDDLLRQLRQTIDDQGNVIPGYERRQQEIATRLDHMRQEALNPDPVSSLEDIPFTAEGISVNLESAMKASWSRRAKGKLRGWGERFWDPIPTKNDALTRQVIQMQREEFPRVVAGTGVEQVFREVAGPENQWADWLVQDRALLDDWLKAKTSGTPEQEAAALDALTAHAGGDELRSAVDDLYASDEWAVISSLWAINLRGNGEEAFGTHFFDQYRSPLLRSINHPVLGVYPASWAIKTAREWAKFLFDNRAFGTELRLGMQPAVAISEVARSQAVTFAQDPDNNGQTWDQFMRDGPLGSTLFVFNLLMPGDWSSLPFPLSRTIREVLRGNLDPGAILASNITYSGVTRDLRLGAETWGEWVDLALGNKADGAWTDAPPSVGGMPMKKPKKPPKWVDQPNR